MKASTLVLLGLGALVLLNFANLGVASNVLQYYIQNIDFTGLTTGRITLMVQNPSNAGIQLNSMAGTIVVNGTNVGNISNFQGGVLIPANQQIPVVIVVVLSLTGLLSSTVDMLTSPTGANKMDFVISGNANINAGIIVPFSIEQSVNV